MLYYVTGMLCYGGALIPDEGPLLETSNLFLSPR